MKNSLLIIFALFLICILLLGILFSADRSLLLDVNCWIAHTLLSQVKC